MVPVSLLPYVIIKWISSAFYVLLYHVIAYRKKIVIYNIQNSFPELRMEDHIRISKQFYRHLCDTVFDTIISFSASKRRLLTHISCKNPEVLDAYYKGGRSVAIAIGHYNSWEYFLAGLNALVKSQIVIIFMPLTNKFMNKKMTDAREAFGTRMISKEQVKDFFNEKHIIPTATVFAVDQWPGNAKKAYWMNFLNQDTAVAYGIEKYARDFDLPVVYARINKERRGYYSIEFVEICNNSKDTKYGFITESVTRALEKDIQTKPEFWLWSHRRWKKSRSEVNL
jgi:Kdo2-lipid IVA lauroyltransferase/acyltransferase